MAGQPLQLPIPNERRRIRLANGGEALDAYVVLRCPSVADRRKVDEIQNRDLPEELERRLAELSEEHGEDAAERMLVGSSDYIEVIVERGLEMAAVIFERFENVVIGEDKTPLEVELEDGRFPDDVVELIMPMSNVLIEETKRLFELGGIENAKNLPSPRPAVSEYSETTEG